MDENGVAIAALGVLATSIGTMAWVVKKVLGDVAPALHKHAETASELSESVKKNTESSTELLVFMRKLNGKLENAYIQKVSEQTVEHQTVMESDNDR